MKNKVKQNIALQKIVLEVAAIAGHLWSKGWAERNAGNISRNITDILNDDFCDLHPQSPACVLNRPYPGLAGESFLVTASGIRMRDLASEPLSNIVIIRVADNGKYYTLFSNSDKADGKVKPTSELATHLQIHQMIAQRGSKEKVIVHTHANELIALTQLSALKDTTSLNHILWGMHPETMLVVPKGVGFVPYCLPGTESMAEATLKMLQQHDVALWEKHGVVAIGEDVQDTFDTIDIVCKSARIWLMCKSAGYEPEGLSSLQIEELKDYSDKLNGIDH